MSAAASHAQLIVQRRASAAVAMAAAGLLLW